MPPTIKFPKGLNDVAEKSAFLYRLQERLRLEHNSMGTMFRGKAITRKEWDNFLRSWNEKNNDVVNEILATRAKLKADDSWNIDLDQVFGG